MDKSDDEGSQNRPKEQSRSPQDGGHNRLTGFDPHQH